MSEQQVLPELDEKAGVQWRDKVDLRRIALRDGGIFDDETAMMVSPTIEGTLLLMALAQSEAERERLQGTIDWALGASGEFRERGASEGAYWWRTELRSRALLADRAEPAPVVTGEK